LPSALCPLPFAPCPLALCPKKFKHFFVSFPNSFTFALPLEKMGNGICLRESG
jgi:hypothetical protein